MRYCNKVVEAIKRLFGKSCGGVPPAANRAERRLRQSIARRQAVRRSLAKSDDAA